MTQMGKSMPFVEQGAAPLSSVTHLNRNREGLQKKPISTRFVSISFKWFTTIAASFVNLAGSPLLIALPPTRKPRSTRDRRFHFTVLYGTLVFRETKSANAVNVSSLYCRELTLTCSTVFCVGLNLVSASVKNADARLSKEGPSGTRSHIGQVSGLPENTFTLHGDFVLTCWTVDPDLTSMGV